MKIFSIWNSRNCLEAFTDFKPDRSDCIKIAILENWYSDVSFAEADFDEGTFEVTKVRIHKKKE